MQKKKKYQQKHLYIVEMNIDSGGSFAPLSYGELSDHAAGLVLK